MSDNHGRVRVPASPRWALHGPTCFDLPLRQWRVHHRAIFELTTLKAWSYHRPSDASSPPAPDLPTPPHQFHNLYNLYNLYNISRVFERS